MQPKTNRQQQAINTRNRIYESALALFADGDYEKVTISDICKKAGVSAGHFYNYFDSKETILMAEYPAFDEFVKNEFANKVHNTNIEAILELIGYQTKGAEQLGSGIFSQVLRIQLKTKGKFVVEKDRYFHYYLEQLVKQAIDAKELSPTYSAREITQMILLHTRGILFDWSMRREFYSPYETAIHNVKMLLRLFQLPISQ